MSAHPRPEGEPAAVLPGDYDEDPARFAANREAARRYLGRADVHGDVAERLAGSGVVVDVGGGDGTLARHLSCRGVRTVTVDPARHVARAPRPAVRAQAAALPFAAESFDGAAALWMLYHLRDPVEGLREAHRVLRRGGLLAVSTSSRYNDPELAEALPRWGVPFSFDAESAQEILARVFSEVEVTRWDLPLAHLPDAAALALFLRGRGLDQHRAAAAAERFDTPMTVTKRGMIAWARKQ